MPRPPRTWYFVGTALFGLFVFAVQNLVEIAVLLALFVRSGAAVPETPEQVRALLHNGGWMGLYVIVACPFVLGAGCRSGSRAGRFPSTSRCAGRIAASSCAASPCWLRF
jgi:hypothetical protein